MKNQQAILEIYPYSFPIFLSRSLVSFFWQSLKFFLLAALISLLSFLFFQINNLAKERNLLINLEEELEKLLKENERLKIESSLTEYQLFADDLIENYNFEKIGKIYYIRVPEKEVVKR